MISRSPPLMSGRRGSSAWRRRRHPPAGSAGRPCAPCWSGGRSRSRHADDRLHDLGRGGGRVGFSSAAQTAPPMRPAPHRPVSTVPENQRMFTRRDSIPLRSVPSLDSGASSPSVRLGSWAAAGGTRLVSSKNRVPLRWPMERGRGPQPEGQGERGDVARGASSRQASGPREAPGMWQGEGWPRGRCAPRRAALLKRASLRSVRAEGTGPRIRG